MILDRFKAIFSATARKAAQSVIRPFDFGVAGLGDVFCELGGTSFNHGLYRVLRADQVVCARKAIEDVFPEYCGRIVPFGFDWLGRHFACDLARVENGRPLVLMLEVGAGEAREISASVIDFHNTELVEFADDALAAKFWRQWTSRNPDELALTDCVGYKVPLFLGGSDILENLEVIDMSVYIEICGQLRSKTRELMPGQSIRNVVFAN